MSNKLQEVNDYARQIIGVANVILMESEQGFFPDLTTINELAILVENLESASWGNSDKLDCEALAAMSKLVKRSVTKSDDDDPLDNPLTGP